MKQVIRTFIPGSEWVYFKIYAGSKTLDNILIQDVAFVIEKLNKLKIIEKWFFIRYGDPDSHIRVRLLINDVKFIGDVTVLMYQRLSHLIKTNMVWKVQLDTYDRELNRYGHNLIHESESFFFEDSKCILNIITLIKKNQNENYRWMIALSMIDSILSDFSFDLHAKKQQIEKMSYFFMTEFGFNEYNSKQFNSMFRDKKKKINAVLSDNITDENLKKLFKPIKERSKKVKPIIQQLQSKMKLNNAIALDNLLSSYIHMAINRLFMSDNRIHELVLYDFLRRYYASEIAKSKYNNIKY